MLNHQLENWLQSWTLTVQYLYHYLLIIATEQKKTHPKMTPPSSQETHTSVIKLFHTLHSFMNNELKFKTYFL